MTSKNLEKNKTGEIVRVFWQVEKYQKKEIEKRAKKANVSQSAIIRGIIDESME